jgi:sucrose-6-phosphate hydrolase SacC (GH32 family)
VVLINGVYHMWFSVFDMQSKGYRLGYARSPDGVKWTRYYEQILPLTPGDFDSSNQSYPYVVDMGQQLWMFYTGNSFGSTGIGLATLDKDKLRP